MLTNIPVTAILPAVDLSRAKSFYKNKLGLTQMFGDKSGVMFKAGKGTMLYLYLRKKTKADHTVAGFNVKNIEKIVTELRKKGIKFEDYKLPGIKTVDGIATMGKIKSAWFKDSEGNILALNQM